MENMANREALCCEWAQANVRTNTKTLLHFWLMDVSGGLDHMEYNYHGVLNVRYPQLILSVNKNLLGVVQIGKGLMLKYCLFPGG